MGSKSKKSLQRRNRKRVYKVSKKKISFVSFYILLIFVLLSCLVFFVSKTLIHTAFYKSYVIFLEKTKVVLYPDILQKDQRSNIKEWLAYNKRYLNQYNKDLSYLSPLYEQIDQKANKESWEESKSLVNDFRIEMGKMIKGKKYYSQTIMMEDLLSLILDMEKIVDKKDSVRLMEYYHDFNSKFTFVIPVLIKTDAVKIGELMDQLYKKALFQTMESAKPIYQELKLVFIASYRDYKVK